MRKRSDIGRNSRVARRTRARRAKRTEEERIRDNEKSRIYSEFRISQETEEERKARLAAGSSRTKGRYHYRKNKLKKQQINEIVQRVTNDKITKNNKKRQFSKGKIGGKEGFLFPKQLFDIALKTMHQHQYTSNTGTNMPQIRQKRSNRLLAKKTATATSPCNNDLSEMPILYWNRMDIKSEFDENQWMNGTEMEEETNIDTFSINSTDGSNDYQHCKNMVEPDEHIEDESLEVTDQMIESPVIIEIKPEIMDNFDDETYIVPDKKINIQYNSEINTFQNILQYNTDTNDGINTVQNILQYNTDTNDGINTVQNMFYNTETNSDTINYNTVQRIQHNIQNINGTNGMLRRIDEAVSENVSISEKIDLVLDKFIMDKTSIDPLNLMVITDKKKRRHKR